MAGYNFDELEQQAQALKDKLQKHDRVQRVNIDESLNYDKKNSQEYILKLDEQKANLVGTNSRQLFNMVGQMTKQSGAVANLVMKDGIYPVYIKSDNSEDFSKWDMINKNIITNNKVISLKSMGDISLHKTSGLIVKENRQYIRMVGMDYLGSSAFGEKYLDKKLLEMKEEMPIAYTAERNDSN